ncbi:MAG: hypothetical protein Q7R91_01190 [bacterium]|nr:hypothetical protein [bacterium]
MAKYTILFVVLVFGFFGMFMFGTPTTRAQNTELNYGSESSPPPAKDAILKLLKPDELFKTLQNYIKVPLPGTGVKEVEINKGKVSELNQQVNEHTGVDLIKFFKFTGKILVIILETAARLIRGLLSSSGI